MHPIFFSIGSFSIRWYGVMMALGFLAAHWAFQKRGRNMGLTSAESSNLILLLFLSGIVGAKIYYVIFYGGAQSLFDFEALRSGFVFYGGFIGAVLALLGWCRWKKLPLARAADALSPPLALGHAFGRVGCFMQGCCYGLPAHHFWCVHFQEDSVIPYVTRHPTQLYEAFGLIDIFFTLAILEKLRRYPGYVAWSYVLLYSLLRFCVEFFRGDLPRVLWGRFTVAQEISAVLMVTAWVMSARMARRAMKAKRAKALEA